MEYETGDRCASCRRTVGSIFYHQCDRLGSLRLGRAIRNAAAAVAMALELDPLEAIAEAANV